MMPGSLSVTTDPPGDVRFFLAMSRQQLTEAGRAVTDEGYDHSQHRNDDDDDADEQQPPGQQLGPHHATADEAAERPDQGGHGQHDRPGDRFVLEHRRADRAEGHSGPRPGQRGPFGRQAGVEILHVVRQNRGTPTGPPRPAAPPPTGQRRRRWWPPGPAAAPTAAAEHHGAGPPGSAATPSRTSRTRPRRARSAERRARDGPTGRRETAAIAGRSPARLLPVPARSGSRPGTCARWPA